MRNYFQILKIALKRKVVSLDKFIYYILCISVIRKKISHSYAWTIGDVLIIFLVVAKLHFLLI